MATFEAVLDAEPDAAFADVDRVDDFDEIVAVDVDSHRGMSFRQYADVLATVVIIIRNGCFNLSPLP